MGRTRANVSEADALSYVFGYATGNDFSARDLQLRDGRSGSQFMIGKTPDGSSGGHTWSGRTSWEIRRKLAIELPG